MSELEPGAEQQQVFAEEGELKPVVFAVRLDPAFREQIEGLRGITGQGVNDVGVEALQDWVTKTLSDPTVREKAMAQIEAEEERLRARRAAITGILGGSATGDASPKPGAQSGASTGKRREAGSGNNAGQQRR